MRYYFILLTICVAWIVGIALAHFKLTTDDRVMLYAALMVFTLGMYVIGFTSRKS